MTVPRRPHDTRTLHRHPIARPPPVPRGIGRLRPRRSHGLGVTCSSIRPIDQPPLLAKPPPTALRRVHLHQVLHHLPSPSLPFLQDLNDILRASHRPLALAGAVGYHWCVRPDCLASIGQSPNLSGPCSHKSRSAMRARTGKCSTPAALRRERCCMAYTREHSEKAGLSGLTGQEVPSEPAEASWRRGVSGAPGRSRGLEERRGGNPHGWPAHADRGREKRAPPSHAGPRRTCHGKTSRQVPRRMLKLE